MSDQQILIIYNAKSDLFSKSTGLVHKLIHPTSYECELCKITHGPVQEKKDWSEFLESLEIEWQYVYKDQLSDFSIETTELPAIYFRIKDEYQLIVSKEEIANLSLAELILRLKNRLINL